MSALPTFRINGTDYRVNKYGVVFGPRVPDPHFDGWEIESEVSSDVRERIAALIQPAFLRWDRNDRLYSITLMRRLFDGINEDGDPDDHGPGCDGPLNCVCGHTS